MALLNSPERHALPFEKKGHMLSEFVLSQSLELLNPQRNGQIPVEHNLWSLSQLGLNIPREFQRFAHWQFLGSGHHVKPAERGIAENFFHCPRLFAHGPERDRLSHSPWGAPERPKMTGGITINYDVFKGQLGPHSALPTCDFAEKSQFLESGRRLNKRAHDLIVKKQTDEALHFQKMEKILTQTHLTVPKGKAQMGLGGRWLVGHGNLKKMPLIAALPELHEQCLLTSLRQREGQSPCESGFPDSAFAGYKMNQKRLPTTSFSLDFTGCLAYNVPNCSITEPRGEFMRSTIDKLEGLARKLKVEIPAETVRQAFEKVYKGIQREATIKGFRKGKAPMATIRSIYADKVRGDVVNDLVNESYGAALAEHNLEPVGFPKISFEQIEEEKTFAFTAEFEVRPEVKVDKFEGLPVQKEKIEIGEDRITTILENIRNSSAETVTVFEDRAVAMGDVAVVDFEGFINGQPLEGGSAQGHELELGSKQFIEGFEEGLAGMKIGEMRELNLHFPQGYHEPSLSGAPVTFKAKLTGIKKKQLPEITDEFAKKISQGRFESLQALKEDIRRDLQETEEKRVMDDLKNRVVKALVEKNPVQAPVSLVSEQKEALIEDFKKRMTQQGLSEQDFAQYKEKWDADFTNTAEYMVRSTFLMDTLADKLNLRATKEDIDGKMSLYARQTGLDIAKVQEFYGKPERRSRLAFQVTEEKVVNYLIEKAKIEEVAKDKLQKENEP